MNSVRLKSISIHRTFTKRRSRRSRSGGNDIMAAKLPADRFERIRQAMDVLQEEGVKHFKQDYVTDMRSDFRTRAVLRWECIGAALAYVEHGLAGMAHMIHEYSEEHNQHGFASLM